MSLHHYEAGREICLERHRRNWPYYALIQAAMREGDTENRAKLRAMWPEVWDDLWARYDAPGGILPTDPPGTRPPERLVLGEKEEK